MTKKETFKWVVQIIASIATAILTAMGTTSCIKKKKKKRLGVIPRRIGFILWGYLIYGCLRFAS